MQDREIVEKLQQGDKDVFSELLNKYEAKIFRIIIGLVCNYYDAEELTQEVFVKVYENIYNLKEHSSLVAWITRIAVNHTRNFLRRKNIVRFISMEWLSNKKHHDFKDECISADIEATFEQKEHIKLIQLALKDLSQKHRALIVLSEINDMDYKDIAKTLKIPIGTVKSGLSRAKDNLKKILIIKGINYEAI